MIESIDCWTICVFYLGELRDDKNHCTIQWSDTNQYEVIVEDSIRLSPRESIQINRSYSIEIYGKKRLAKVLAIGSKEHCESVLHKYAPHQQTGY